MTTRIDAEAMAAGLAGWVEIESPTHFREGVNRMLDAVAGAVAGEGIAVERHSGRDGLGDVVMLRAGPRNGRKGVLVLAHVDTVHPVGTLAGDLPVRREGDRLYGPGIYDMKGGAYLALEALRRVAREGSARVPLSFLFTPDEEIGSPTTRAMIEEEARRHACVLVTEPARDGGKIVTARKGVGRFDVEVEGRPAHAGTRHADGRSAIVEAARQIVALQELTDYARGVTVNIGEIEGGTAANVVPQHARFSIDLRVANLADGETFTQRILALRPQDPDTRLRVTGGMNRPPYAKTPEVAGVFAKARVLAGEIGLDLQDVPQTGGGSDGNFTAALGSPTLDGLGIDGDGAHTLQEFGLVSSLEPRSRLMEVLLVGIV